MLKLARYVLIAVSLASALQIFTPSANADTNSDRIVVMISVDGLAAYYIDDPKAEMPTLRKLAAEGARAASMRAVTPTVTWPNHTTLVTGDYPGRHGVVGNNYFNRETGEKAVLIGDPVFDKDQIVKVPTIYDIAKADGLKTASVRWPATRNAKVDWILTEIVDNYLNRKYATSTVLEECEKAGFNLYDKAPAAGETSAGTSKDDLYTSVFNMILKDHRPNLALLHIAWVDHTEHLHGPKSPEAYAAVKAADEQVRMVWEELQRDFPGRATLVVVSDHGFSPIEHQVLPNVILKKAGLIDSGKNTKDGAVHIVVQGGSAFIYVKDEANRDPVMKKVREAFKGAAGISKIAGPAELKALGVADPKVDPHAPDMMIFAEEGCTLGDTAGGALPFVDKPERKGSHGHDASLPDLHATFVIWGAGIKPGVKLGEIKNIDVAPTIAKLLNIQLPKPDGKPLSKVLAR